MGDANVLHMIATGGMVLAALTLILLVYSVVSSWIFLNVLDYWVRKNRQG